MALSNTAARAVVVTLCFHLAAAIAGAREIDLRGRPDARRAESRIKSLGQGNEGDGGIDRLTLNTDTGEVVGEVWVRHRQVAGYTPSIYNPISGHREGGDPIVVYDDTMHASFHYNARNGTGGATLDLGRGIRLSTKVIEDILAGDVAALLRDAVATIPSGNIVRIEMSNEYGAIVQDYMNKYGPANVYFASQPLVDWLSPETAGDYVIAGLIEGAPAAVQQAMNKIQQQTRGEAQGMINWLRQKGVSDAESVVLALLSGQRVQWPFMAVKWQTVGYFSQRYVGGQAVGPRIRSTHAAFVVIWGSATPQPLTNQSSANRTGTFVYVHSDGQVGEYVRVNGARWINRDRGAVFQFVTQQEAGDHIDLYDASRNMTIRLGNDGGQSWTTGQQWNGLERGAWR